MRISIFLFIIMLSVACDQNQSQNNNEGSLFNMDTLAKDISVLSSDAFEGRKPFTEGENKTINYLKERFTAMGTEPGNGDSYFQEVPMVDIATEPDSLMQVQSPKGNFTLKGFDDYVIWTEKTDPVISLENEEVIFAGYGVVAPEYNWNDYAGIDVKGKIVLLLVNDPGYGIDSTLFRGDTMTYYGRWTYKFEEAARQGAKGCLIIHNTKGASYPFTVPQNNWKNSRLRLDDRNKPQNYCSVVGWIQEPVAKNLFIAGGLDTALLKKASQKGFKGMPLNLKLSTKIKVKANYNKTQNVIAKITGAKYPDEYIIYTAHWDHLGIGKPDETGDSIYNGAVDNASGTAGLLQLASAFKKWPKPDRTIVFLSVTAEEQGLWGSEYYAQNPVYPLHKTLANINTDGLNKIGKTKDIIVVGRGQSELEDYLEEEAKKKGRYISFETKPEGGSYYRSDHFNFAKVGVPALYAGSGVDVTGKEKGYGKKLKDEYGSKNYHRPSDEYDDNTWILDGAIEDTELIYNVGQRLSSAEKWPQWKKGSEFKVAREKMMIHK